MQPTHGPDSLCQAKNHPRLFSIVMDAAVWDAAIRDARRWERFLPEAQYFELEGELVSPADLVFFISERVRCAIPPAKQRWFRLGRHARVVAKAAQILRQLFEEVTFRPAHTGAKRCRDHFYALSA